MDHWLRSLLFGTSSIVLFALPAYAEHRAPENNEKTVPDAQVVVRLVDDKFVPSTVEIRRGQTILWKNVSLATHTVTCDPGAARFPDDATLPGDAHTFDSGPLGLGQTYSHTFDVPGVYRYYCMLHEAERMVGTVVVTP